MKSLRMDVQGCGQEKRCCDSVSIKKGVTREAEVGSVGRTYLLVCALGSLQPTDPERYPSSSRDLKRRTVLKAMIKADLILAIEIVVLLLCGRRQNALFDFSRQGRSAASGGHRFRPVSPWLKFLAIHGHKAI
jgi:hypothetical protein